MNIIMIIPKIPARLAQFLLSRGEQGQSSVEYLVVTGALIASLITLPNIYDTFSHTIQDKYKSYAFSVAISDPPSKKFDDEVHHTADIIEQIENLLFKTIFPDISRGKMPAIKDIKNFFDLLKSL
ncbi:MAG: hypothetical protein M8357_12205 [Desulfobulbaceae bacterium]|nr:hypothetical protein [Desulfobulbaceae bacterium]